MKFTKLLAVALSVAVLAFMAGIADAHAQSLPKIRVTSGGEKGTYFPMVRNMAVYCAPLQIENLQSGGSDENIERLLANGADLGIVQVDLLFKRSKIDNDDNVKKLLAVMPLHIEAMHVVVLDKSGLQNFSELGGKPGNWAGMGKVKPKTIAVWGGSIESAVIIKALSGVNFEIDAVQNVDEALNKLNAGQVDALLAMGGQPLGWVKEKLKRGTHHMVTFDVPMERVQGAYRRTALNYASLGVLSKQTIGTNAALMSYNFTDPDKVRAISLLRQCLWDQLSKMQQDGDVHGQWRNVEKDKQVDGWSYFAGVAVQWPPVGGGFAPAPRKK